MLTWESTSTTVGGDGSCYHVQNTRKLMSSCIHEPLQSRGSFTGTSTIIGM